MAQDDLEQAIVHQRVWVENAGPLVPESLLRRPAPRSFVVEVIPGSPRDNALWYRAMSLAFVLMARSRYGDDAIDRTLLRLSAHAAEVGRAFPGVANLRSALGAYCGYSAVHPEFTLGEFLEWLRGLRRLEWLELPGGGEVYDWEVLARPRSHPLHIEPLARDVFEWLDLVVGPLPDLGWALDWFERLQHGKTSWLTGAELKTGMIWGGWALGWPFTLVVSLAPGPDCRYEIESISGERGDMLRSRPLELLHEWHRTHPDIFGLATEIECDTN